ARRVWSAAWPKLAAFWLFILIWQTAVWLKLKPTFVLPGPAPVFRRLYDDLGDGTLVKATWVTMQRAGIGFGLAVLIGSLVGVAVARSKVLRAALGSLITGLQTMPTIAWFPLTILFFGLTEKAILFVVVLGAAPAVANGVISGVDHIPPLLLRAGRVLGARGLSAYRHVIIPASLPGFVAGLKQGWAFAWRSLMAGELLVIIAKRPSLGVRLQLGREASDAQGLMATMLVILVIGIVVDSLFFGRVEHAIRRRWGLIDSL
ncbi:MAG: ABC-type probable sulfate transporter permease protein, partial [Acidimicrobiales bacterium]|nr:ABC-type probable sulfate transporter permease protein [Acidimicrobiales bacterium]